MSQRVATSELVLSTSRINFEASRLSSSTSGEGLGLPMDLRCRRKAFLAALLRLVLEIVDDVTVTVFPGMMGGRIMGERRLSSTYACKCALYKP